MAVLNSIISFLGANERILDGLMKAAPGKVWHLLILNVFDFIVDYGWRIVVFTILLKLVLSPLDFYQRYKMHKNQKITERLKPTMEKIQKQYGDNKQAFSQKQMELNRKEGYSYFSSCLPMIATLVIFITLWQSMNTVGQYMTFLQYGELHDTYYTAYEQVYEPEYDRIYGTTYDATYEKQFQALYQEYLNGKPADAETGAEAVAPLPADEAETKAIERVKELAENAASAQAHELAMAVGQAVVYDLYYDGIGVKETNEEYIAGLRTEFDYLPEDFALENADKVQADFLWIDNIWAPDVPWGDNAILQWSDFTSAIGMSGSTVPTKYGLSSEQVAEINSLTYGQIMQKLIDNPRRTVNGYLILPILVVLLSVASQLITLMQQKRAGQVNAKGGAATSMKVMMFVMPLLMIFFALRYASIFTLYMVINSAMSLIINFSSTAIVKAIDKRRRRRNYGISTGSPRAAVMYKKSPIIHYVKGANPNAGAREIPLADPSVTNDGATADKKSKKSKREKQDTTVRAVRRGGRPDPNELMGISSATATKDKKKK